VKYDVRIGERSFEVDVDGERVRVGGRELVATLVPVPGGPLRRLILPDAVRTVALVRSREGWTVHHHGRSWTAEVVDERTRSVERLVGRPAHHAADGAVWAPMPGLVLRVEVTEGQQVAAGAGLVVLEAMKMENEIRAPVAGAVRRILVAKGEAVEKGTTLLEVTPNA